MKDMASNRAHLEELLQSLLHASCFRFSKDLQAKLPDRRGIYAISVGDGDDTRFLWIGITPKSKGGLRRRIYEDHYLNPTSTSDLPNVLRRFKPSLARKDARHLIEDKCRVRWIELEDKTERELLEHYAIALLQPNPEVGVE